MYARLLYLAPVILLGVGLTTATHASGRNSRSKAAPIPNLKPYLNPSGFARTLSSTGSIDTSNPFFQSIGSNGRSCVNCHEPSAGFSITPPQIRAKFLLTAGLDPLFRTIDGSNSPRANVSTTRARLSAYSMLLNKGLVRVGLPVPSTAEFELVKAEDPYGFASAKELSLFRRPLPTTNLRFISAVMWDGRETQLDPSVSDTTCALNLHNSLLTQANSATRGHAEGFEDLTSEQADQIVHFQMGLHTAQSTLFGVGNLDAAGATGGPQALSTQNFFLGINDPLGHNPTGAPFDARAVTLFNAWRNSYNSDRRAIARGQDLFNTKPIRITGVAGLNDDLNTPLIVGTCTTCHDSPNVGNHSAIAPLNIGLTEENRRTRDMPLYTLRNKTTGQLYRTTDPGRALITGKWKDIGRFKGPVLRGLASRAPYFHNGFAPTLRDVVEFYESRFSIGLTRRETEDLTAFLKAL